MTHALIASLEEMDRQMEDFKLRIANLEEAAKDQKGRIVNRNERWISARELAKHLSVSITTIHNWTKEGKLVKYKMGRAARYDLNEVNRSMEKLSLYHKAKP